MSLRTIPLLLTCGPLALTVFAGAIIVWKIRPRWPRPVQIAALSIVSANAAYAAATFLYYTLKPTPDLPPWKDPETLNLGLLFLTAPIGIIVSFVAAVRGAPKWPMAILIAASAILMLVGIMEAASV
jgi:peptidoglycan biosynthesis protein MviN/MurJ (putative lipid II flippase)